MLFYIGSNVPSAGSHIMMQIGFTKKKKILGRGRRRQTCGNKICQSTSSVAAAAEPLIINIEKKIWWWWYLITGKSCTASALPMQGVCQVLYIYKREAVKLSCVPLFLFLRWMLLNTLSRDEESTRLQRLLYVCREIKNGKKKKKWRRED